MQEKTTNATPSIKDSGVRTEFTTGGIRELTEDKGRCDLLPLDLLAEWLDANELKYVHHYIYTGHRCMLLTALEIFIDKHFQGDKVEALLQASLHYKEALKKYPERNFEKGLPLHTFIDSGVRHFLKHLRGDTDERHDWAFIWNMLSALWTQEHKPDMIDLPFKEESNDNCN